MSRLEDRPDRADARSGVLGLGVPEDEVSDVLACAVRAAAGLAPGSPLDGDTSLAALGLGGDSFVLVLREIEDLVGEDLRVRRVSGGAEPRTVAQLMTWVRPDP